MLEILEHNFFLPLYAIAWILSLVKLPKYFDSILKYFPILIGYTLCTEVLGMVVFNDNDVSFIFEEGFSYYNVVIYNLYDLLFFTYFFYVYYHAIAIPKFKTLLKYGAGSYLVVMILNVVIDNPLLDVMWYAYAFGAALLVVANCAYLFSLKGQSKARIFSDLLFWVSIGSLLFHIGYTPIMILQNIDTQLVESNFNLIRKIHLSLIVIMYFCYCIGFLTMRRMPAMKGEI